MNLLKGSKLFERIFNRGGENEQNIEDLFERVCENCGMEKPSLDRVVGNPVNADNKIIYPIIEIAAIGNNIQTFKGVEIFPIALVVEEPPEKYVISLTGEEIDSDEFIKMVSEKK